MRRAEVRLLDFTGSGDAFSPAVNQPQFVTGWLPGKNWKLGIQEASASKGANERALGVGHGKDHRGPCLEETMAEEYRNGAGFGEQKDGQGEDMFWLRCEKNNAVKQEDGHSGDMGRGSFEIDFMVVEVNPHGEDCGRQEKEEGAGIEEPGRRGAMGESVNGIKAVCQTGQFFPKHHDKGEADTACCDVFSGDREEGLQKPYACVREARWFRFLGPQLVGALDNVGAKNGGPEPQPAQGETNPYAQGYREFRMIGGGTPRNRPVAIEVTNRRKHIRPGLELRLSARAAARPNRALVAHRPALARQGKTDSSPNGFNERHHASRSSLLAVWRRAGCHSPWRSARCSLDRSINVNNRRIPSGYAALLMYDVRSANSTPFIIGVVSVVTLPQGTRLVLKPTRTAKRPRAAPDDEGDRRRRPCSRCNGDGNA